MGRGVGSDCKCFLSGAENSRGEIAIRGFGQDAEIGCRRVGRNCAHCSAKLGRPFFGKKDRGSHPAPRSSGGHSGPERTGSRRASGGSETALFSATTSLDAHLLIGHRGWDPRTKAARGRRVNRCPVMREVGWGANLPPPSALWGKLAFWFVKLPTGGSLEKDRKKALLKTAIPAPGAGLECFGGASRGAVVMWGVGVRGDIG